MSSYPVSPVSLDSPDSPVSPLLLLHGFTGGPSMWDGVVGLLSRERPVLRPALLGHAGGDVAEVASSFEDEVDRVARLVREAGLRGLHLCGYSLGARIGLGLLVRAPELFARATLIGVNPGLKTDEERDERQRADERWVSLLEREGLDAFLAAWEAQPLFASQRELGEEERSAQRAVRGGHSARGLSRALRELGLGRMPSYWDHLSRIAIPVTLMAGERDSKFRALAEEMAGRFARAVVVIAPGAGHNVVLEKPSAVVAELETPVH